ncbi:MAG: glycerophosphodiester phosphodiesterase [Chitinophagaceae bacterium]|nr:glycerophosphodiester phosphodiesterase [Chitinophagaceae bacterium]
MKISVIILLFSIVFISCKKEYDVVMPDPSGWDLFKSPAARILPGKARQAMEGVYTVGNGNNTFGDLTAIKWSYVINTNDSSFHVSGFFGKDIAYFICEGKQLDGAIIMNGYWRKMVSTETGLIRLTITAANGANILLSPLPAVTPGSIVINGVFGNGQEEPELPVSFAYNRPLHNSPAGFNILAHRSGGRNSDLLPVSENSVEMVLKTAEFGSTGIEIDVRFTKDGIPIIYHDNDLNLREVQKSGLVGPIENYTYAQLSAFVRLIHGERIPTLRQVLNTVVYQTQLSFVWLDTKYIGSLEKVQTLAQEFKQRALQQGRNVEIVIGLPGRDQINNFLSLPDYASTPSLCELSIEDVQTTNARIWAPRFTEGTQNDKVAAIHAQGRKAFAWTLDVPEFIEQFIREGDFDGILSNYPSCIAYYYYVQQ